MIQPVVLDHLVEDRAIEGGIPPRADWQVQVSGAGNGREARIDHDEFGPVVTGLPDPMGKRRESFAHIGTANDDDLGMGEIGIGVGCAIQSEGLFVAGTGTDHAQAPVVIEVFGFEGDACELADKVTLFIGKGNPGEHGKGIGAVLCLDALDIGGELVKRGVPGDGAEAGSLDPRQGFHQSIRMVVLQVALDAFWTKPSFIERKLFPWLEADHAVVFDQQFDTTLHAAKAAMGLDHIVGFITTGKPFLRREIERRTERSDQLFGGNRQSGHGGRDLEWTQRNRGEDGRGWGWCARHGGA